MEPSEPLILANIGLLPNETIVGILLKVEDLKTLTNLCQTNQRIRMICQDDRFWKKKYQHDYPDAPSLPNLSWREMYKLVHLAPISSPVSAGAVHYAVIDDQNMLYMGGYNRSGQLGIGQITNFKELSNISPFKQKVRSVSCGVLFTGAVTEDGKVYLWGNGLGAIFGYTKPKMLRPTEFKIQGKAIKITCGPKAGESLPATFAVILEDRSIVFRKDFFFDDPGSTDLHPAEIKEQVLVNLNLRAIDISVNGYGLAIVSTDRKLYYLGKNLDLRVKKKIGVSYLNGEVIINPVHIPLPEPIKQVSLAFDHIGALSTTGNLYLWGNNQFGQLGQGWNHKSEFDPYETRTRDFFVSQPQKLSFPVPISFISCQNSTTAVIDINGKLYRWGMNRGFIDSTQYEEFEDAIFVPEYYPDDVVIYRPVQIDIGSSPDDDSTIVKPVNYVAVGSEVGVATTNDGVVNIWRRED